MADYTWTQAEVDRLIRDLKRLARMIGCEFVPDPKKLARLRIKS